MKFKKGIKSPKKDKTYEELYGIKKANEIKEKLRLSHLDKPNPKLSKIRKQLFKDGILVSPLKGKHHTKKSIEKIRQHSLLYPRRYWLGKKRPEIKEWLKCFPKGGNPWNTGLTKETDKRLKEKSERLSIINKGRHFSQRTEFKKGHIPWMTGKKHKPESIKKMLCIFRPTKPEQKLNQLLQLNFPNEWKYVGNGEFILAGKNPDFINCNGKKQIIELYGNYWHKNDVLEDRINLFKQYGFNTIIIWENELKSPQLIVEKIKGEFYE